MLRLPRLHTMLLAASLAAPALAATAPMSLLDAVNLAGRQRMLGQRIIKNRVQATLHLLPEQAAKQQSEAVTAFDAALRDLKPLASSPTAQAMLRDEATEWSHFLLLLPAASNADALRQLDAEGEKLLASCHALTLALQDLAATDAGRTVNLAGRTRMLSQRLAKYYLLGRLGKLSASQRDQAEQARTELQGAITSLLAASDTPPAVQRELELGRQQWFFFDSALNQPDTDPLNVAVTSENLVEVMERVTTLLSRNATSRKN